MNTKSRPSNWQIVIFFIGFVLLFFLVFALGVIVGKGLNNKETIKVALNEGFDNENVGAPDGAIIEIDKEKPGNEKETAEQSEATKSEKVEDEKPENKVVAEDSRKNEKTHSENAKNKIETKKEVKSVAEPQKKVEEVKKKESPIKKADKTKTSPKQTSSTSKETDTIKEKKVAKLNYDIPDFPTTDPGGKFTVQLGSFQNAQSAFDFEKKLNAKGYPSFIEKIDIPNKGTWYRVRVGSFNTKEKAKEYADKLKSKEKLDYSQVTLNQ